MPPPAAENTAVAPGASLPSRKQPIGWQELVVPFAVGATAGWIILLGYGLGKLITQALKMAF